MPFQFETQSIYAQTVAFWFKRLNVLDVRHPFASVVVRLEMPPKQRDASRSPRRRGRPELTWDNQLVLLLVSQSAWGLLSAVSVQQEAHAAYEDQVKLLRRLGVSIEFSDSILKTLAELGSKGKYEGNIKRDLMAAIGYPQMPEAIEFAVPMRITKPKDGGSAVVQEKPFPVLAPHEVFAYLFENDKKRFYKLFMNADGENDNLKGFWDEVVKRKDPRVIDHDMQTRHASWRSKAVPIMVHGDGVPCVRVGKAGTKSFDTYSWQAVLARGSTLMVKILLFGLFEDSKVKLEGSDGTMFRIWDMLMWSFWFAYLGIWPTVDWRTKEAYPAGSPEAFRAGKQLANGLFLVVWSLKGDLEHLSNKWGLEYYGAHQMCPLCPATYAVGTGMSYNNFKSNAAWMKRMYTPTGWRSIHPNPFYLLQLPFLSCWHVEPYELHVLYLGTAQYFLGSVLALMVYTIMPETPKANLHKVWTIIAEYYKENGTSCQFSHLQLSLFSEPKAPSRSYPRLSGRGAEVKDICGGVAKAWATTKDDAVGKIEDRIWILVSAALKHQLAFQKILSDYADDNFLPPMVAKSLMSETLAHLQAYSALVNWADAEKLCLFSMVPKHHWLVHLAQRAFYLNPRRGNTLVDEDFVGRWKKVVAASAHGTEAHAVPLKTMEKYRWGMHFLQTVGGHHDVSDDEADA